LASPLKRGEGEESTGGVRVAMSENENLPLYFVTDHLGSTTKLINTDGTEYSDMEYLSWGSDKLTPPDIGTSFKYTGQRQAEAGLYFYNTRWYDPKIGRFIQADSIIPESGNPLAWDRYAYTLNNPINNNDPSGHQSSTGCNTGNTEGCELTQTQATEDAQKYTLFEKQVESNACSSGDANYCSRINDVIASVTGDLMIVAGNADEYTHIIDETDGVNGIRGVPILSMSVDFADQYLRDGDTGYSRDHKITRALLRMGEVVGVGAGSTVVGSALIEAGPLGFAFGYIPTSFLLNEMVDHFNEQVLFKYFVDPYYLETLPNSIEGK
jgi:RHS repeat-associated protein